MHDDFPEPCTPTRIIGRNISVSELPAPRRLKVPRFGGEDSDIPPISTITSQERLAALLEDNTTKNPLTKADTKQSNCQEDPFSGKGISKAPKKLISALSKPPGPPGDDSSSESESEPIKPPIPPRSDKRPTAVTSTTDPKPKCYHFDLKLKSELVPQWDGNPDNLARWISKINHLANNSLEIKEELGKIVPRRFTPFTETWYYSILDAEHKRIEENWTTLKKAISEYWMNHHWVEKQKLRTNRARFREAGHQQESPSQYVIHKMELLTLVYSYMDTETIQAIMMEFPGMWASIINPQCQKTLREFQNTIKYHEESLKKLEAPVLQPPCLPNQEYASARFSYHRANANLVRWSKNIGTPLFPKDDSNVFPRKTPDSMGARPCRHCESGKHWDNEC